MKLVLVSYMPREDGYIPIGLLTLAAIARQEGVRDIRVLDLPGKNEEVFIAALAGADIVGFSSICSTYNQTIRLCQHLKTASPATTILLGGPQASLTAEATLVAFPFIDVIFVGEAEHSWRQFLRTRERSADSLATVNGLMWRDGTRIRQNSPAPIVDDLETLPLPSFDLYVYSGGGSVTPIEIGRGCPFACSFCSSSPCFGRKFRLKSVDRILREMDLLHERYGSRTFYFVQDSFSVRRSFVESICDALENNDRRYPWYCSARLDQLSPSLLTSMKRSGCRGIYVGLETGSSRMQKLINKNLNIEQALVTIQQAAREGFEVTTSMIIGFPQETVEDLRDTLRVFLDLKSAGHRYVQLHVLAPMTGSPLSREGHVLRYDSMPSDFSDTDHLHDSEDRLLIRRHPDIFSSFWYYENPSISRQRFLFLADFLTTASLHLPNTLRLAATHFRDSLIDRLLGQEVASLYSHSGRVMTSGESLAAAADCFERFGRQTNQDDCLLRALRSDLAGSRWEAAEVVRLDDLSAREQGAPSLNGQAESDIGIAAGGPGADASALIDQLCGACGECCVAPGGILCGRDEWPDIRDTLVAQGIGPIASSVADGDLLAVDQYREVDSGSGRASKTRLACPALVSGEGWRCSIEDVKPAGCIAYPLKLVLRECSTGAAPWLIALEFDGSVARGSCPLERVLRSSAEALNQYREHVRQRIGVREGAFALARYNAEKLHASARAREA